MTDFVKEQVRLSQVRAMSDCLKVSICPDAFMVWRMFLKRLLVSSKKTLKELVLDEQTFTSMNNEFVSIITKGNWRG